MSQARKISAKMLDTLKQLKSTKAGQTTSFGYIPGTIRLNAASVKALLARSLLEESGSLPWQTAIDTNGKLVGHMALLYHISAKGEQVLQPIYTDLAEAQTAMDRGETVRIELEPLTRVSCKLPKTCRINRGLRSGGNARANTRGGQSRVKSVVRQRRRPIIEQIDKAFQDHYSKEL